MQLKGKYNQANIFIDKIDKTTEEQIRLFLNQPMFKNTYIAIMPDCHKGIGSCIGFTMKMNDYIIPNLIGVDINCGIETYNLGQIDINFQKLDNFIKENIPTGFNIRKKILDDSNFEEKIVKNAYQKSLQFSIKNTIDQLEKVI